MKKLSYLIVLTLILGLVLTGCLLSNVGQVPATGQKGMPLSTANLVALWHFDEVSGSITTDSSLSGGNDGTVSGASLVDGKLGKALSFDGSDDYVDCGDSTDFEFSGDFSVEVWVKHSVSSNQVYVSKWTGAGSGSQWWLGFYNNKACFGVYTIESTPDWRLAWGTTDIADGEWHHVVGVRSGTDIHIYQDGAWKGNGAPDSINIAGNNAAPLTIGNFNGSSGSWCFNGDIDEVRIWDGALTADDILYSYADETLHVDDDWAQWPGAYYTINEALAVAVDGDTIIVHEGTYTENVTVSKKVTLLGANHGVDPAGSTTDRGDGESVINGIVKITADDATINGFKMTSNSYIEISDASKSALNVNVSYNILENTAWLDGAIDLNGNNRCAGGYIGYNTISGTSGYGIQTIQNNDVTIEHNHVLNSSGFAAIDAGYHDGTGIVIHGNTITNSGGKGINYWAEDGGVINDNVITDSTYEAIFTDAQATISGNQISGGSMYGVLIVDWTDGTAGGTAAGSIVSGNNIFNTHSEGIQSDVRVFITNNDISGGYNGIQLSEDASGSVIDSNNIHNNQFWGLSILDSVTDVTVQNNQFADNPYCGVIVWGLGEGSGIHINFNNITGNGLYGVESKRTASDVDATRNWWGHPGGPRRPAGNSDKISGPKAADQVSENVLYHPWLSGANSVSNIALNQAAIASATWKPDTAATLAVDGDYNTLWNAGAHPTQWIEIDLGKESTVVGIRLLTAQSPVGDTTHVVLFSNDGSEIADSTFSGYTENKQWLEAWFDVPLHGVKTLRVTTTESLSWVAWFEIEIYGWQ